ncbi:hypothetical protein HDU96_007817 [Phlyctochytrium bullatum]|nr:hypothetical protein HDU96_007817 [Phlyctochytrium bullatum]
MTSTSVTIGPTEAELQARQVLEELLQSTDPQPRWPETLKQFPFRNSDPIFAVALVRWKGFNFASFHCLAPGAFDSPDWTRCSLYGDKAFAGWLEAVMWRLIDEGLCAHAKVRRA